MIAPGTAQGVQLGRARAEAQANVELNLWQRSKQLLFDATGIAVAAMITTGNGVTFT